MLGSTMSEYVLYPVTSFLQGGPWTVFIRQEIAHGSFLEAEIRQFENYWKDWLMHPMCNLSEARESDLKRGFES